VTYGPESSGQELYYFSNLARTVWFYLRWRDELLVREPGGQEREGMHSRPMAKDLEVIFRKIWPESRKEGGDWRDDWHSLPLAHI